MQDIPAQNAVVIVKGLETWLEQHFRAAEAFGANSDDVSVWELVGSWPGTPLPRSGSVWRQQ